MQNIIRCGDLARAFAYGKYRAVARVYDVKCATQSAVARNPPAAATRIHRYVTRGVKLYDDDGHGDENGDNGENDDDDDDG